jgi:hypothetical protein
MKRITVFLMIFILFVIFSIPYSAFAIKKLAQTGFQFLKIGVGARPAGMGEAFMLIENDANTIFYNPAGIAKIQSKLDIFASRTNWIAGIAYNAAGLAINGGIWGNFGISVISPDYPSTIGTRVAATEEGYIETGEITPSAILVGVAYGRELTDRFAIGGLIKYASQNLGTNLLADSSTIKNDVSSLAYDFGTIFYPGIKSFRFGMSIQNFSPEIKYQEEGFQLPLTFKIGIAMDILDFMGEHQDYSFLLAIDAIHPRDYTERIHIGGEFWFKNMMALRAGYKFNYDEEDLTAGVGFKTPPIAGMDWSIKFDYSYSNFENFDAVNRFSLGITF